MFVLGIWLHVKKYLMQRGLSHPLLFEVADMCDKYSVSELPRFKTQKASTEALLLVAGPIISLCMGGLKLYCILKIS